MSSTSIRVGVVGVGSMGRHHARVYQELAGTELVGIADKDQQRAAEVADEFQTAVYGQAELFDRVDAVTVAVPTRYHYEVARAAMLAEVHVIVEKPFVDEYGEGRDLISVAQERDLILQVGHVERFNPAVVTLSDIAADLDIIAIEAQRLGPPLDRDISDGVALDLMIHDIDILLSLVDSSVTEVNALSARDNQHVAANLLFENGVIGDLTASRVSREKVRRLSLTAAECRVNVNFIDHTVEIHRSSVPEYVDDDGSVRYRNASVVERPTVENGEPLKQELTAFTSAVRDGTVPVVSGEDGLRALDVVRRIEDVETRRPLTTEH